MNVVRDVVAEFPWHQQQLHVLRAATDVISANGGNQCTAAGVRVLTARGMIPVEEVVVGDTVFGPEGLSQPVVETYVSPEPVPVFRLRTKRGYEIVANASHPLMVAVGKASGWHNGNIVDRQTAAFREVADVRQGEYARLGMRSARAEHAAWPTTDPGRTEDDGYFLGLMTGDGWWRHDTGRMSLTAHAEDESLVAWLESYLAGHGVRSVREEKTERSVTLQWCNIEFKRLVMSWGVVMGAGAEKRVPEAVWRGSEAVVRGFLQGLFDADGCATTKPSAVLVTTSPHLARGTHTLLARLGVTGSLHYQERPSSNFANPAPRWRLEVAGRNAAGFAAVAGFRLERKQQRLPLPDRRVMAVDWDRIASVEPAGEATVYGFTCPPGHSFYGDGLLQHNSGKTMSGLGVVARLIRREGPIYARLRNPEHRTIQVWVAPKTLEKYLSVWEPRIISFVLAGLEVDRDYDYKQNPFPVFKRWRADGTVDWIIHGKAQKQGFLAFESDAVDLIVLDEEPEDPRIISSCKARFSTTNGVLVLCFTPLLGMSFTYHQFYAPTVKPKLRIGERAWRLGNEITVVEMGMADNPESVAGGGVARLQADPSIGPAEKAARLWGKYGYTEGLLVPALAEVGIHQDDPYSLDDLPQKRSYSWILAADPNKRHGALLAAIDHEGNRYYCQEHYFESLPDSKHAEGYRAMMDAWGVDHWMVDIWADPGGAGSQAILNLAECGIFAKPVQKDAGSVSASIKRLRGAAFIDPTHRHPVTGKLGAPRTYFIRWNEGRQRGLRSAWSMNHVLYVESRLCWEIRQYRQDEGKPPDTPVKVQDDVVDCARYIELARSIAPEAPMDEETARDRAALDPLSTEASDAFEAMARKAEQKFLDTMAAARSRFESERAALGQRRSA